MEINESGVMIHDNPNFHLEKDLKLSAYLLAAGLEFLGPEVGQDNIIFFKFSPRERAQQLVTDYFVSGGNPLPPQKVFTAFERIRDVLHRIKRGENYGR